MFLNVCLGHGKSGTGAEKDCLAARNWRRSGGFVRGGCANEPSGAKKPLLGRRFLAEALIFTGALPNWLHVNGWQSPCLLYSWSLAPSAAGVSQLLNVISGEKCICPVAENHLMKKRAIILSKLLKPRNLRLSSNPQGASLRIPAGRGVAFPSPTATKS